jgi:hypothetical protein
LETIDRKVHRPRQLDTTFEVFGSENHPYQLNPPLRPEDVDALERRHRFSLPDEYRAFITQIGNGGAGPDYGLFSLAASLRESACALNRPFPFSTQAAQGVIAARRGGDRYAGVVPDETTGGALAICDSGCAIFYYLVLNGEQRGTVWHGREDWFPCFSKQGRQWTFLDWYEDWLDRWLVPGVILGSMTEEVWLRGDQAETMLRFAGDRVSERKRRLVCVACCRHLWDLLPEAARQTLMVAERFADGRASGGDLATAREAASRLPGNASAAVLLSANNPLSTGTAVSATRSVCAALHTLCNLSWEQERHLQAVLIRDVLGNPFQPVSPDPSWSRLTVRALAKAAYEERRSPDGSLDVGLLGILADALEEAGCHHAGILTHLRIRGPHAPGCWPLDLLLGKE